MTPVTGRPDGRQLTLAYEALRAAVLGGPLAPAPRGLALFLRGGLAGWLAAWARLVATPPAAPRPRSDGPPAGVGLGAELATLLAHMALVAHREGPRRDDPGRGIARRGARA